MIDINLTTHPTQHEPAYINYITDNKALGPSILDWATASRHPRPWQTAEAKPWSHYFDEQHHLSLAYDSSESL
jgi:hypothetical protein